MRIAVLTQDDPFYLPAVFKTLLEKRAKDIQFIAIFPPSTGKETGARAAMKYFRLYGFVDFCRQISSYAWYRLLGKFKTASMSDKRFYSVEAVAKLYGVEMVRPKNPNSPEFLEMLKQQGIELGLSVACPQIMRKKLLGLPPLGVINIHGAILPRYRGMMPSFWVLANKEKEAGVTVHYANEKLDDGPIIAQRIFPIAPNESQHSLITRSKAIGAELLLEVLDQFEAGKVVTRENDASEATYNTFPTPEQAKAFRKAGGRFF